jgi:purine-binding chemotaxis protein CheW
MLEENNDFVGKNDKDILQYVTFYLDKELYGINISQVKEVINMTEITSVPKSLDFVVGMINLRGQVLPVIDLRKRLSLKEKQYTKFSRIVIAELNHKNIGMIVDKVDKVQRVQKNSTKKDIHFFTDIDADYIDSIAYIDEHVMIIINLESLIGKI